MGELYVAYIRRVRQDLRRQRVFRDRENPLEVYDDQELLERFRLPKREIQKLMDICLPHIQRKTQRNSPLPPILQLTVALR